MISRDYTTFFLIYFLAILTIIFRMIDSGWANIASVVAAVILVITVIYNIVKWICVKQQKDKFFNIAVSLDPSHFEATESNKERRTIKKIELIENTTSDVLLLVKSKQPYSTRHFHLFFNTKKKCKGKAPKSTIELLNIVDESKRTYEDPYLHYDSVPDNAGAINIIYDGKRRERGVDDTLYLTVTIKTTEKWSGYLVLYGSRKDGNRGYGYLPVEVKRNCVITQETAITKNN